MKRTTLRPLIGVALALAGAPIVPAANAATTSPAALAAHALLAGSYRQVSTIRHSWRGCWAARSPWWRAGWRRSSASPVSVSRLLSRRRPGRRGGSRSGTRRTRGALSRATAPPPGAGARPSGIGTTTRSWRSRVCRHRNRSDMVQEITTRAVARGCTRRSLPSPHRVRHRPPPPSRDGTCCTGWDTVVQQQAGIRGGASGQVHRRRSTGTYPRQSDARAGSISTRIQQGEPVQSRLCGGAASTRTL